MSSHGMTPYIMITKESPNTVRMTFWRVVMVTPSASPRLMLKCSWFDSHR